VTVHCIAHSGERQPPATPAEVMDFSGDVIRTRRTTCERPSSRLGIAGLQKKFDWKGVAMGAISGAVGGAVGPGGAFGKFGAFSSLSKVAGETPVAGQSRQFREP
jgi:hypothetical protein